MRVQRGELIQAISSGPYSPCWLIDGRLLNLIEAYEGIYNAGK